MSPAQSTSEFQQSLKDAITKLLAALQDASDLTIETRIISLEGDPSNEAGNLVAFTKMEIDGDTLIKVPVSQITSPVINKDLLDLHNQNLERALKYRSELLKSAQDLVKDLIEMLKSS